MKNENTNPTCVQRRGLPRCARRTFLAATLSLSAFLGLSSVTSCSDNVDESNLYSFTGDLITSYLNHRDDLSDFRYLCSRVRLSPRSQSTMLDLLSARGNYTGSVEISWG